MNAFNINEMQIVLFKHHINIINFTWCFLKCVYDNMFMVNSYWRWPVLLKATLTLDILISLYFNSIYQHPAASIEITGIQFSAVLNGAQPWYHIISILDY